MLENVFCLLSHTLESCFLSQVWLALSPGLAEVEDLVPMSGKNVGGRGHVIMPTHQCS